MKLLNIVNRTSAPAPWAEGDNIPWNDPEFSQRMLKEHLSQEHGAASRRAEKIGMHVDWIHHHLLLERPAKVLDLACGPGLYTQRLAKLGHECVGIDFAPASTEYAKGRAHEDNHDCTYLCADIRQAEYGSGFDLAMLIFGQFNVFRPTEAEAILKKARHALAGNGLLLLEPQTLESIRSRGQAPRTWSSAQTGLFSERPYICLEEKYWDAASRTTTERFYIVDADTGSVARHALTNQAYTTEEFESALAKCGFTGVEFFPSLGDTNAKDEHLIAIVARKGEADGPEQDRCR